MNGRGRIPRRARSPTSGSVQAGKCGAPEFGWTVAQLIAKRNVWTPVDFILAKSRWSSSWPLLMPNSSRGAAEAGAAKTAGQSPITSTAVAIALRIRGVGPGIDGAQEPVPGPG